MWSKFRITYLKENKWVTENIYYYGDFSNVDYSKDWRFKKVPGKRDELIFLGLIEEI